MSTTRKKQPLYRIVKQHILNRIEDGRWTAGMKIDSEAELVAATGASRMTVNRALRELTAEGTLTRRQGLGSFVAERKSRAALLEIKSIAREITDNGGEYSCSVHLLREENANPELADFFHLAPYDPVFHSVIVHKDRGVPIQLDTRFINPAIAPDYLKQDFHTVNPSDYLLDIARVSAVEHEVEALLPEPWIRELLDTGTNEPCLALYRKTWVNDTPATRSIFYYPGSRYTLCSRFTPTGTATINVS